MDVSWSDIFDYFGTKTVTQTDKAKGAYVPNEDQKDALAKAGLHPGDSGTGQTIDIPVLFDSDASILNVSYYKSVREGSGRTPEARIGRDIVRWTAPGDVVVIGVVSQRAFIAKANMRELTAEESGRALARQLSNADILSKALKAAGPPARKTRRVVDFVRSPFVVAAALQRAAGKCEMPSCTHELFLRDDGAPFLEVHHVKHLAEGGDATLTNTAALCPMCHRELHFGNRRSKKREVLAAYVEALELARI